VAALNAMILAQKFAALTVLPRALLVKTVCLAAVAPPGKPLVGAAIATTQQQTSAALVRGTFGHVGFLRIAARVQACAMRTVSSAVRMEAVWRKIHAV
jgi:hypothetical protein